MAIQETKKKLHMSEFEVKRGRIKDESPAPTMSLTKGNLRFNRSLIEELQLEAKFVKLYGDPSNSVIGFRMTDALPFEQVKSWKLVKPMSNGTWQVSVRRILLSGFDESLMTANMKGLEVHKYVERNDVLTRGNVYYYVELRA